MAKERLTIPINFKNNKPEEVNLYNELINYSSPSSYIKDVLLGKIKRETKENKEVKPEAKKEVYPRVENDSLEILDILGGD